MKRDADHKEIEPEQLHKNQSLLQVLLPVIAAGVICLVVFIILIASTSATPQSTEQWAQISTMFLILPAIFLGLACLAILLFLGINADKWNKNWPPVLRNFRLKLINLESILEGLAQKPAKPIISLKSAWAGILALLKK